MHSQFFKMPSPIRVPIHQKLNSYPSASAEEDANDAITAYLTRLLTKHERNQPLVYEDLLESYEVAKAVSTPGTSKAQQELEHLHKSQLMAYEAYARTELTKLGETLEYPDIEEGESMPAYIERCVHTVRDGNGTYQGWRVSEEFMKEVFWSKVKAGARKAYFALKSRSIEKDKQGKTADQKTDKVKAFEAAALGALVSKSESQDSEMADDEEGADEVGDRNVENGTDMDDDEEAEEDDEDEEDEEEEPDAGDDDETNDEADDDEIQDEKFSGMAKAGSNGENAPAVKTPMKTKKRRRLPNGPLGGGSTSTADGSKKQQPAKKQKTGKGANGENTGGGGGRGSAGGRGKGGKTGRGGGGGRGTRKRNRKKGTGAGAGGVA